MGASCRPSPASVSGRASSAGYQGVKHTMSTITERSLGFGFGLLGGALIALAGLVSLVVGTVDLATGRSFSALNAGSEGIVLLIVGALAIFFAYLAHRPWRDQPVVSGVLLVVLATIGWGILGLGVNVLGLVGALFVFLAGVLYLVGPLRSEIHAAATA